MELLYFVLLMTIIGTSNGRKNVLFLVSDDLRPELGSFATKDSPSKIHPPMHSPNLDALASRSLLLKRAYVQQALCSPSRTSVLTGRRPDTTHVYDLHTYFRKVGGNFTTIPEYFKMHGYVSVGMGKIFHSGKEASGNDDPISWSLPYFHGNHYWDTTKDYSWRALNESERKVKPTIDEQVANHAITTLRHLAPGAKSGRKPFFIAVGFRKPHLPFVFPDSVLSSYPVARIHAPDNEYAPEGMPRIAWSSYGELRAFKDVSILGSTGSVNTTLPDSKVKELRRAYYSAISWMDIQVGRVVDELKRLGLDKNTIVSFWGDHGYQLGEHGEWCKHTNFDIAIHAPMMIRVPGLTDHGIKTEKLTEFVDLFPTLVEAAGLPPLPVCPEDSSSVASCHEGMSLMPLMKNRSSDWKHAAFSQYPRTWNHKHYMGYTLRTNHYRYTEWAKFTGAPMYKPDWSSLLGVELYDHQSDPDENHNKADDPSYHGTRNYLSMKLHAGWRAQLTIQPPIIG